MGRRDRHPGDRLAALVDARLAEPERSSVAAHVARCPECLAEYDAQLAMKGLLGQLPAPGEPADLRDRLVGVPAARPALARRARPRAPRSRTERLARAGAMVATVSLAALGLAYAAGGPSGERAVVPPVDRYVREHVAVSVGVPLTAPALSQLAKGEVPLLTPRVEPVVSR